MYPTRRQFLDATVPTALAALSGCTSGVLRDTDKIAEFTLSIHPIRSNLVEHTLYKPGDDDLFGDPARVALDEIIPEGTHETYGWTPLRNDDYVAGETQYFQIDAAVTGRRQIERQLVRGEPLDDVDDDTSSEDISERAIQLEALDRPNARVIQTLDSHSMGVPSDMLRDDAYVLRRPAERESRLATDQLDGQVVTMGDVGTYPLRVSVTNRSIREPEHTTRAIPVAADKAEFRKIAFARVDTEVDGESLPATVRDLLDRTIGTPHTESPPLSAEFEQLLTTLRQRDADESFNDKLLWCDEQLYRYGLFIDRRN